MTTTPSPIPSPTASPAPSPTPSPIPSPIPELPAEAVEEWRAEEAQLIDLLARTRQRVGGVAAFRIGPRPTVLVTDPEAAQHVLARHPDRYVKRSHRARVIAGEGVLSATGEAWKNQRRMLQAQFTGPGMRRYEARIAAAAHRTADRWAGYARTGERFDVGDEMRHFALDTIWRALTGHPLDTATETELDRIPVVVANLPQLPDGDPAPAAVAQDVARIDAVAHAAIATARRREDGPDGSGVLRVLLDAAEQHPEYTDRLIRDELVTLLFAGHETTATTLTWLFLLLNANPEARDWALAAGPDGSPERREALQALVSETLRLYPSAWILPRHALTADTLAGHHIEAGTDLLVCPYLTHRDPDLWPDPERFDPTRFTTTGTRPTHLGAYLPFGLGARACLGIQFALRESVALLELLLPAYAVNYLDTPKGSAYSITVRPDGPSPALISVR